MAVATSNAAPAAVDPRTRTQIVAAVMLGLFLAALDQTVVGTALPRIVTDLHGNDIYTWAFTAYLLTATISGPIYGKLSSRTFSAVGRSCSSPWRSSSWARCSRAWRTRCGSSSVLARCRVSVRAHCSRSRSRSSGTCSSRPSAGSIRVWSARSSD